MNSSNNGDKSSGFSNSNEPGSSMEFKTPHFSRSRSVVSRPRFIKVRKSFSSLNNRSLAGTNFNPFGPGSENSAPASSAPGLGVSGSAQSGFGRSGNEAFVFGEDRNLHSNSSSNSAKCDSNGNLEKQIVGEMRNLRVGSGNEPVNAKLGSSVFGAGKYHGVDESMLSRFPNDLRKFNTRSLSNIDKTNFVFGNGELPGSGGAVSDGNNTGSFVFGSGKKGSDSFVKSSASMASDQMMNLNAEDSLSSLTVENNEMNMNFNNKDSFSFVGNKTSPARLAGQAENAFSDEISGQVFGKQVPVSTDFSFQGGIDSTTNGAAAPSFSSSRSEDDGFGFTSKKEGTGSSFVQSKTPNPKGNRFRGASQKLISTMRESGKRRKGKLKQNGHLVQPQLGQEFALRENSSQETHEAFGSYAPMEVSPYQETSYDNWRSRGTSVASDDSLSLENNFVSADTVSNAAIAPQRVNSGDVKFTDTKEEGSECYSDREFGAEGPPDDSMSMVETESFKSAVEEADYNSDIAATSAEFEASSIPSIERKDSTGRTLLGFPPMADSNFTFATPSTAQGQSTSKRHHRKKSSGKTGPDAPKSITIAKVPYVSSTSAAKFFPRAEASLISSSTRRGHKGDLSSFKGKSRNNSKVDKGCELKNESNLASTSTIAAQEACEKWRLRGNQAYANGDLSKAEDYYTEGINCIPKSETSRSCLRALMLCYSNRAATRMSLGRMRNAIGDCVAAATIDPNFLKVQVRAANCYLALGEVEDASRYYTVCLESGSDCVDRKMAVEASDGLQMAQKVSECMHHCAELLEKKTSKDAESVVELIAEALLISSHSEKLLEMKAEALFMLRRYEEIIRLCEGTFDSAEKNAPLLDADGCSDNSDASETSEDCLFRTWRCRMLFHSYFHLGRLEEALASLEKHDEQLSFSKRKGNKTLESSTPLAATVRELLRHKAAGNEAFQAGRHGEAVEHYTAALSCNVESRTFAAICICSRAAAYKSMGQITDAIADCSLAIALDGNYLKAISRRATLFEMIRDYGQAASDIRRLVTLLSRQVEGKSNHSTSLANDLKQAHQRLSEIEERAKKEIPLDMYLILGVEPSVSVSDVKKAYRKAALRHHPDKASLALARSDSGDEIGKEAHKDADKLFKMIGEAYAVLSESTKRSWYDAEEEMRISMKRRNTPKWYADGGDKYPFERSASARQWRSSANAACNGGSQSFRSNRY